MLAGKKGNKNQGAKAKNAAPKAITKAKAKVNKATVIVKNVKKAELLKETVAKAVPSSPKGKKGKAKQEAKAEQETIALPTVQTKNKGKKGKKAQQANKSNATNNIVQKVEAISPKAQNKKKGKNKTEIVECEEPEKQPKNKGKKGKKQATLNNETPSKTKGKMDKTIEPEENDDDLEQDVDKPKGKRASKRTAEKNGTDDAKKQKTDEEGESKLDKKVKQRRLTLFIGNLPFKTTPEEIKEHFAKAGNITSVRLVYDAKNVSKGYGYIDVADNDTYERCASMHHTMLSNRRINVEYTGDPKEGSKARNVKNAKLSAMRQKGLLLGSKKQSQKRSTRRKLNKKK